jgi:uncharacterized protein involved in response to NO
MLPLHAGLLAGSSHAMPSLPPFEPLSLDTAAAPPGFALWNLGFRPFYLLAGLFAAASVPVWIAQYAGWLGGYVIFSGPLWHAHEMLFGFAFAVIVGFLFTAGRNWSNQPTPSGAALAAIAALWIAARVLVFTPYALAAAAADTAFAIAAAAGIAVPFARAGNRRNYFFVPLLIGLGLANLAFHLGMAGVLDLPVQRGLQIGLDLVLFIMVVMSGRVIPMFTMNGVPGVICVRVPWIERLAPGSVLALLAADAVGAPAALIGSIAAAAAAVHAARLVLWRPWLTLKTPIVWILHFAYAWIVLALALDALAAFALVPASLATHAMTVGAIGGLTIGMMTRTSRGHTGRSLQADGFDVASYVLVVLSALVRVGVPLCMPALTVDAVIVSAVLWCAGFALFAIRYAPSLVRPRLDGKPG